VCTASLLYWQRLVVGCKLVPLSAATVPECAHCRTLVVATVCFRLSGLSTFSCCGVWSKPPHVVLLQYGTQRVVFACCPAHMACIMFSYVQLSRPPILWAPAMLQRAAVNTDQVAECSMLAMYGPYSMCCRQLLSVRTAPTAPPHLAGCRWPRVSTLCLHQQRLLAGEPA
jgi:hypothetical protein